MKIRKKLLSMLLTAALVLSLLPSVTLPALAASDVWDGTSDTDWYTNNSTATSFTITTAEEFAGFRDLVNAGNTFSGKTITLGADIVLNDVSNVANWSTAAPANAWTMIGSSTYFAGTFNGAGHTVSGVYTSASASYTQSGLFGYNSGTVQNLGVVDSYIGGIFDVGGVVMTNSGTVSNCYNTGVVSCNAILEDARMTALAAGVVGENSSTGTVTNCYNTGAVTCGMTTEETSGYAGGVVGKNEGTVSNCYNTGAVTTSASNTYEEYSGGVTGYNSGTVSNCYNTGSVSGYIGCTGGVAGGNTGTISNCYSKGSVSGFYTVGGVVGYNYGGTVSNCYNTGSVSGAVNYAGGVVAHNNGGTVSNCYNTGDVAGYSYAYLGGVVGQNAGTVSYCYSAGAVSGSGSSIGGVAGSNSGSNSGTITGCYYNSTVCSVGGIYGNDVSGSAEGKETADMQTATAFTDWDTSVWTFKSGEYPQLKAFVVWDATTDTTWYNSTDTSFTITTAEELAGLRYLVNNGNTFSGKSVTLGADIRLNDVSNVAGWSTTAPANTWTSIGTASNPFSGTFNGGGYTVSGVYISNTSDDQGLFGYISGGTVRNLGVVSSYISGGSNVGGVAGYIASGTVTGCCNTGIVAGSGSYVGGVTGYNAGTVTNCYNTGDVTGGDTVGGVTGSNDTAGTVSYCYSAGTVSGSGSSIGGVAGSNSGTITGCYYDSEKSGVSAGISNVADSAGSVEGKTTADMQTETAFTDWDTSVWCFISGGYPQLWIFLGDDTTDLTWYTGNSAATDFSVGTAEKLAGLRYLVNIGITFSGKTVTLTADIELNDVSDSSWYTTGPDCTWTAIGTSSHPFSGTFNGGGHTVSGVYIIGESSYQGLFGYISGGTVRNLGVVSGYITGDSYVGGVAGYMNSGTVTNCYFTGYLYGETYAGGVAGYMNSGSTIISCYNMGKIVGKTHFGGVVGFNLNGTVTDCYNTGYINANRVGNMAGGVVGLNAGTVSYCYNTGFLVTGEAAFYELGGVVGFNSSSGNVTNCYNTGNISIPYYNDTTVYFGGVVGDNYNGTVTNCYNTGNISGYGQYVGGVAGSNTGTVSYCYSAGSVAGYSSIGSVVAGGGTVTGCYYDKQLCTVGGIGGSDATGAAGLLTSALATGTAFSSWSSDVWNFTDGLYPRLTGYVDGTTDYEMDTTDAAYLSASPVTLASTETVASVSTDFSVSTENSVSWSSSSSGLDIASDGAVTISAGGTNVVLTATRGGFSKSVTLSSVVAYTISAIDDQTLTDLTAGYASGSQETKMITIKRTGNGDLTNLAVTLGGTNSGSFSITTPSATTLNDTTTSTTFTIKANDSLSAGSYTATVTVSADNMKAVTFDVGVTVFAIAPTYSASVDPTSKTFTAAEVSYGTQTAQEFTVENTGTGTLTNLSAALTSGTNFEISTALSGDSITSGNTATVSVRPVTGLSEGTYTDTLTITGDNSISLTVSLSFTVSAATTYTATVTPTSKTFTAAEVSYGTQTAQEFTIENTGTGSITSLSASLGGSNFEISTALSGDSITSGNTATVSVRPVTGLSEGTYTDTLTITGDNSITLTVDLSFTVSAATTYTASVDPTSKTFTAAEVSYGTQTAQEFTIENTGTGTLTGLSAALGGSNFEISTALSGDSVTSGNSVTVSVRPVTELSVGTYTDTLTITGDNGISLTVNLSFTVSAATTYTASVDPTSKTFTAATVSYGTQTAQEFTITNTGTGSITSLSASLGGSNFEISTALSDTTAASGGTATVSVRPVTGLSVGTYTDTLTITGDNGINLTVSLSFTVSAATTYTATVTPTSKTFTAATVSYGTQTAQEFTISNTGTGTLTNLSAALGGSNFEISTALSGTSITSGNSATLSVRPKTSLSAGTYTDTLTITGDNGINLTVSLSFTVSAENPSSYTITASAGSGGSISPSGSVSVSSGGSQTFTITPSSNYSISSVTVDSVSQGAISTYTFSNVSGNHTISATFTYTGGSSGGSTGGSSSGNTQTSYSATMSGDGSGKLTVTVDEDAGSASAALSDAQGKLISGGKDLAITMPEIDDVTDYILGIPVSSLSSDSGNGSLTLNTGAGSVTIPSNMLTGTDAASGDTAKIEFGLFDSSELSDEARNAVGDRPVVSLTLYIDAAQTDWSNPDAPVTVSIPYTPADGEDLNAIVVWYIDGDGNLNCVQNGHYDSETGTVTFQTTHFSLYAVSYNGVSFTDVADTAWYYDAVSYLAARGIVGGNNGAFNPDASITRAEFVTILARMSGDDLSGYTTSSFTDVIATDWYFVAVQWAYDSGVATGYDGKFNPNTTITREQMAVMLYRYADYAGDISNAEGMSAREFTDYDSISSWAQASIQWAVNNSIITGNPDGSFAPAANATRAQAAKMIAVLLQSVIVS